MDIKCAVCESAGDPKILWCGRCNSRSYCGLECQRKDWPSHKPTCQRRNYILKIDLHSRTKAIPKITRTISCPAYLPFVALHGAIQIAFGWNSGYPYDFDILDVDAGEEKMAVKLTLWKDADWHINKGSILEEDWRDSEKTPLQYIFEDKLGGMTMRYNYGWESKGGWRHDVKFIGRSDKPTGYFEVLDGEGVPTEEQEGSGKLESGIGAVLEGILEWEREKTNEVLKQMHNGEPVGPPFPPSILLLSLEKYKNFDEKYAEVLKRLRSKARIQEATHPLTACHKLINRPQQYMAIILTDNKIARNNSGLWGMIRHLLSQYIRHGGTTILAFDFASFPSVRPSDEEKEMINKFIKHVWTLNWECSRYRFSSRHFRINPKTDKRFLPKGKENDKDASGVDIKECRIKGLCLRFLGIEERVYLNAERFTDSESPVAWGRVDLGYLGYLGFMGDREKDGEDREAVADLDEEMKEKERSRKAMEEVVLRMCVFLE